MSDLGTVRAFLVEFDPTEVDVAHDALDRIEAVVKAARELGWNANEEWPKAPSRDHVQALARALSSLDETPEGRTP